MQKDSDRSKYKSYNKAYAAEISHYKGKMKLYKSENNDLKEQLQTLTTQYVKVWKDKDKYKKKIINAKEDIDRFNDLVESKSSEKASEAKKEIRKLKKALKKKDNDYWDKWEENKQLRNQLDEQNEYVLELEARIQKLQSKDKSEEEEKEDYSEIDTPSKEIDGEIEIINKKSYDDEDDVIITTKPSSQKKVFDVRKEAEYPSEEFGDLVESPEKNYKADSKFSETVGKVSKNTLISSLPVGLRETSYFDNIDQCRTLLGEKRGKSHEKLDKKKLKDPNDPSFGEWELNLETDYDFE